MTSSNRSRPAHLASSCSALSATRRNSLRPAFRTLSCISFAAQQRRSSSLCLSSKDSSSLSRRSAREEGDAEGFEGDDEDEEGGFKGSRTSSSMLRSRSICFSISMGDSVGRGDGGGVMETEPPGRLRRRGGGELLPPLLRLCRSFKM